jgi:hypothetical protein
LRIFEQLHVNTGRHGDIQLSDEANLTGAVARNNYEAKIAQAIGDDIS